MTSIANMSVADTPPDLLLMGLASGIGTVIHQMPDRGLAAELFLDALRDTM